MYAKETNPSVSFTWDNYWDSILTSEEWIRFVRGNVWKLWLNNLDLSVHNHIALANRSHSFPGLRFYVAPHIRAPTQFVSIEGEALSCPGSVLPVLLCSL